MEFQSGFTKWLKVVVCNGHPKHMLTQMCSLHDTFSPILFIYIHISEGSFSLDLDLDLFRLHESLYMM
jgi:hypothetical protein